LEGKWWWKLDNENGIWQDLVKAEYLKNKVISNVKHKLGDSRADLLKIKHIHLKKREISIKNGEGSFFGPIPGLRKNPCVCNTLLYMIFALTKT
jgi:hypothetical protein